MKTFSNKVLTKPEAEQALDTAIALVRRNLPLYTDHCQNHSSVHDIYPQCENNQWTCGFWPGEVWLSYERTGDEAFKNTALTLVDSFLYRIEHKIEVDHHDMGFLYSPSCVAAYKLTGSEKGRRAAILAADQLCTRFQEKGEFFQAWGALGAADNYRYIIDCLLNVPLLLSVPHTEFSKGMRSGLRMWFENIWRTAPVPSPLKLQNKLLNSKVLENKHSICS